MTATILTTIFLLHIFYTSCDLIEPRTTLVNECPKNENETIQASKKLQCEKDKYNNSQYLCLPHVNKTSFVEFCFNGTMGIQEKGNCLEADDGKIILYDCSNFLDGCPDKGFVEYEFYIYPACQNISTELHCYLLDPFCLIQSTLEETTIEVKETTTHEVKEATSYEENDNTFIILSVSLSSVFILVLVVCFVVVLKKKYFRKKDFNTAFEDVSFTDWDAENDNEIRIVLLGKTGAGKSATGNTILGGKIFESMASASSITNRCTTKSLHRFGRKIMIVDTPGIFDTSLTNQRTQEEIRKCIAITCPGPHAFVLVLSIRRFTEEEHKSVEHFVKYFGEHVYKYVIVLFTHRDELDVEKKNIQDFIKTSPEKLKNLIEKCGRRVIAFNNRLTGTENEEQAIELLKLIKRNIKDNEGLFYTDDLYVDAENRLKRKEKDILKAAEKEREIEMTTNQPFCPEILELLDEDANDSKIKRKQLRKKLQDPVEKCKMIQKKYEKRYRATRDNVRNNIEHDIGFYDSIQVLDLNL